MTVAPYVTLMASLPALGPILAAKRPPIARVRLEARLGMLAPEDRAELDALTGLLAWRRMPLGTGDGEFVARARRVIPSLGSPTLAAVARERLELRTAVAALRRRHAGEDAPRGDDWGYGRFTARIRANWREPDLGLARPFPWIARARTALETGAAADLERILIETAWRQAARRAVGHDFDFEAVALYTVRWMLLERWTRYDPQAAAARFRALASAAAADLPGRLGPGAAGTTAA